MYCLLLPNVPFAYIPIRLLKQRLLVTYPGSSIPPLLNNRTPVLLQNITYLAEALHFQASFAVRGDFDPEFGLVRWKQNYGVGQLRSLFKGSQPSVDVGLFFPSFFLLLRVWGVNLTAEAYSGRADTRGTLVSDDFWRPPYPPSFI